MTNERTDAFWGRTLQAAVCENCDWRYLHDPGLDPIVCPHCYQANLTPQAPAEPAPDSTLESDPWDPSQNRPELVVPFRITETGVETRIKDFSRSYWFTPADLVAGNMIKRLRRLYIPAWLVDCDVAARWQAEVGFDYQVVSHQENYSGNQWRTTEVKETKIRWEPRAGQLNRHYDNVQAPAMEEIGDIRARLGDFDSESAKRYRPELVDQALVRLPNRDHVDAWPDTLLRFRQLAAEECRRASKAEHIRQFGWQEQYDNRRWSLLLVPVYSTFYLDDDQRPVPVLLNGRTGQLHGRKQASMKRARRYSLGLAAAAAFLFLLAMIALFLEPTVGVILGLVSIALGMSAIGPIAYASLFNRRQKSGPIFTRTG